MLKRIEGKINVSMLLKTENARNHIWYAFEGQEVKNMILESLFSPSSHELRKFTSRNAFLIMTRMKIANWQEKQQQ